MHPQRPAEHPSTIPTVQIHRGQLASRAHKLLGLGAVGSAQLSQNQSHLAKAFGGGNLATWERTGTPWIAARALASPIDDAPVQSTSSWLLAGRNAVRPAW